MCFKSSQKKQTSDCCMASYIHQSHFQEDKTSLNTFYFTKVIRHIPVIIQMYFIKTSMNKGHQIWNQVTQEKKHVKTKGLSNYNFWIWMNAHIIWIVIVAACWFRWTVNRGHISLLHYDKCCNIKIMCNNSFVTISGNGNVCKCTNKSQV